MNDGVDGFKIFSNFFDLFLCFHELFFKLQQISIILVSLLNHLLFLLNFLYVFLQIDEFIEITFIIVNNLNFIGAPEQPINVRF